MSNNPDSSDRKALLRNAVLALEEMQARLDAVEQKKKEPIAIVGMACRFPGGANSPAAFWELLRNGGDAVREVPADRWNIHDFEDLDVAWYGGFLEHIDEFDPQFFGIAPREAISMDPQQRLVLQVSWEALENAGQAPDRLNGSATGVFIGVTTNDYAQLVKQANPTSMDIYSATGTALNATAGRLAYTLGLQGPCMAVDTACSSSLVALHLAIQSLRNQECDLAIAGGVNATLVPENFICFAGWGMMAPDGRCKTFDTRADGFVRGEGCGIIVLKRLSDALANGDQILALIRGSAVNQDGRSSGLTVPNGPAQQEVVRKALENAGIRPSDVSYVEAHGTGTALGDPIEVEALGAVLGEGRPDGQPLVIGSVKTNIGHLESASGIAGLMKVILSLQHQEIPRHLHFQERSPRIPWPQFPVIVPTENLSWPAGEHPRVAGVSSFGFSGTNAHVIVEEAPVQPVVVIEDSAERPAHILTLSARDEGALQELAARYRDYLAQHPDVALPDVAFSANTGRAHFSTRLAVVAANARQMYDRLDAFVAGQPSADVLYDLMPKSERPKVAFLFTGQGSQYVGMGWELYQTQPVFREALDTCDQLLRPYLEKSLLEVLYPEDDISSPLDHTTYTQPALFALEYALARLWQSWGIEPSAVLGHSIGELVAACIAGVFSLEDGLRLTVARARLMGSLPAGGQMAAIFADEARVAAAVQPYAQQVSIAAVNGPENIVISGVGEAVEAICAALKAEGVKSRLLNVSHAFHSPLMEPILDAFEREAQAVQYHKPRSRMRLVSNVTGQFADSELQTPAYWRRHIREAVRFGDSVAALCEKGYTVFVEIGPGTTLLGMGQRCVPEDMDSISWLPSLRKGQSDWTQMLTSLGGLYVRGVPVNWAGFDQDYPRRRLSLPTYPFRQEHYWIPQPQKAAPKAAHSISGHPLLGSPQRSPLIREILFEVPVSEQYPPFLSDHRVYGAVVFPGTGYIEMALAAGTSLGKGPQTVENLTIQEALIVPQGAERTMQLVLVPDGQGAAEFRILSLDDSTAHGDASGLSWKLHATGQLVIGHAADSTQTASLEEILQSQPREAQPVAQYYQQLQATGLDYGDSFRCITELWVGPENRDVVGRIQVNDAASAQGYSLHPGLLDACFQLLGAMLPSDESDIYLPVAVEQFRFYGVAAADVWAYATIRGEDIRQETLVGDLRLFDPEGRLVAELEGLRLKRASRETLQRLMQPNHEDWLYEVGWLPSEPASDVPGTADAWLILAEQESLGTGLAAELQAQGAARCDVVSVTDAAYDDLLAAAAYQGVIYMAAAEMDGASDVDMADNAHVLHLVQAMARLSDAAPRLWVITRSVHAVAEETALSVTQSPLWGLGRVIALEHASLWGGLIDVDGVDDAASLGMLARQVLHPDGENQVALRGGQRYVARLLRKGRKETLPAGTPVELAITTPGILDNLELRPLVRRAPGPGEVEVQVRASGLNFRDVLNALGMYPGVAPLGNECAGTVAAVGAGVTGFAVGDEVIALAGGAFKSYVMTTADQVFHKPQNLSFVDSVSVPTTFLTAAYGLLHLAQIQPGQRVLIHAAAGGVGSAAVQLALRAGAEIFATAGSPEKRAYLQSIGVPHVLNSRTLDFADEIMAITNGEGVDVVLNSLADEFIPRSLSVLAEGGTFLEIGKRGIWEPDQVKAAYPTLAYHVYDLVAVLSSTPNVIWTMLHQLLADLESGDLQPLPVKTFPMKHAIDAFRYMAQARHIGKIVVTHDHQSGAGGMISPEATYLVTGGLGGLGLEVASWLVEQGAAHLVLVGRSQPSQAAQERIDQWQQAMVQVEIAGADVADAEQIASVLSEIHRAMPPLRGIIHAAGVLDDGLLVNQDWGRFEQVLSPKVWGAWHLHLCTQDLPLDFFVMFSAGAALLGSSGQGNYAAANAFLDGLAHYRRAQGLPALSINWGAWSEVGMAAALGDSYLQRLAAQGVGQISPIAGTRILGQLIQQDAAQTAVLPINWALLAQQFSDEGVPPFLSEVVQVASVAPETSEPQPTLLDQLASVTPRERRELLIAAVGEQVTRVLGLDTAHPPTLRQGLMEMGMDSLMAVELSNRLKVLVGRALPATLAFEYPTVEAIVGYLEQHVLFSESESAKPAEEELIEAAIEAELEGLSDQEIEASLLDELKRAGY